MPISVRKLTSRIGAVISGVDLHSSPDPMTVAALREALNDRKAIVFEDVDLDEAAHQRVASWFGELTTDRPDLPSADGTTNENSKANVWHTDLTFIASPPQITSLRSIVTTTYGGETLIANTAAAYRDLPEPLRVLADSLRAVHICQFSHSRQTVSSQPLPRRRFDRGTTQYEAEHPVVRVHPLTGERGLFIGGFTKQLVGLSANESVELLRILQSYVTRPENVLRWNWSPRQLLVFDNQITQHYGIDNYDDQPRRLGRVTVAGDVPFGVDGRRSEQLVGDASDYERSDNSAGVLTHSRQ